MIWLFFESWRLGLAGTFFFFVTVVDDFGDKKQWDEGDELDLAGKVVGWTEYS